MPDTCLLCALEYPCDGVPGEAPHVFWDRNVQFVYACPTTTWMAVPQALVLVPGEKPLYVGLDNPFFEAL